MDDNILWIATYSNGLIKYDIRTGTFNQYKTDPNNEQSIGGNYLSYVFKDSKQNIWIGSLGAGLCRFNKDTKASNALSRASAWFTICKAHSGVPSSGTHRRI